MLALVVAERLDEFVGVVDDGLCFERVAVVVVELFFEVGKVGFDFDVVVVGDKCAFHEPRFAGGSWHYGN